MAKREKRLGYGEGSIFKRGKIWYYQIRINGRTKWQSLKTQNREEAEGKARQLSRITSATTAEEIAAHVKEARLGASSSPPLADCWKMFEKTTDGGSISRGMLPIRAGHWGKFLSFVGSACPSANRLSDIDPALAEGFKRHLESGKSGRSLSPKSVKDALGTCRIVLEALRTDEANPFARIRPPELSPISREPLSEDELRRLLEVFDSEEMPNLPSSGQYRVLFYVGAFSGARLKDACLLKWEAVNFDTGRIIFVPEKTKRKTKGRSVEVPMHPALESELRAALNWKTNEYVLPYVADRYIKDGAYLAKDTKKIFEAAGFIVTEKSANTGRGSSIRGFHALRATFATIALNRGVSLSIVEQIVGAGSPVLKKHYARLTDEGARQAVAAMPRLGSPSDCQESELRRAVIEAAKLADLETLRSMAVAAGMAAASLPE